MFIYILIYIYIYKQKNFFVMHRAFFYPLHRTKFLNLFLLPFFFFFFFKKSVSSFLPSPSLLTLCFCLCLCLFLSLSLSLSHTHTHTHTHTPPTHRETNASHSILPNRCSPFFNYLSLHLISENSLILSIHK